ncbi:hypothetical protein [Nocardia vinacea]|uniref:hypothetical protein n=1 Tax=Nocardia vinacea TaxID=96468 RepID=UPI001FDF7605|nr:hypothetical protein [Nocardia vinacea]
MLRLGLRCLLRHRLASRRTARPARFQRVRQATDQVVGRAIASDRRNCLRRRLPLGFGVEVVHQQAKSLRGKGFRMGEGAAQFVEQLDLPAQSLQTREVFRRCGARIHHRSSTLGFGIRAYRLQRV